MHLDTEIHARAGLLGNPSDGYFGKTIACLVGNFRARVALEESETLYLQPNPECDPLEFGSIAELAAYHRENGYYGGLRLIQAACKRFYDVCAERGIVLDGPNFSVRYETDIPRQVGLSGSSALVIGTLRSLMRWYGVQQHFTREEFPDIALSTETQELGITAGLQDRVIQTYGGAVYMDFDRELLEGRGYGAYAYLNPDQLPPLFIAYVVDASDSGQIHSDVRRRWNDGDPEVREAMCTFAGFAEQGKAALAVRDYATIAGLLRQAFALRRRIFGDAVLGPDNLRMVELANQHGLSATTCGSGGAIVGVMGDDAQNAALADSLQTEGYRFMRVTVGQPYAWSEEPAPVA